MIPCGWSTLPHCNTWWTDNACPKMFCLASIIHEYKFCESSGQYKQWLII